MNTHWLADFVQGGEFEDDGESESRSDVCFLFGTFDRENPVATRTPEIWTVNILGTFELRS